MKTNVKIWWDVIQRTDEWMVLKRGKSSGSGIKPILVAKTTKPLHTYAYELISQLEDKRPAVYEETYMNRATTWGKETEPFAVKAFEKKTGRTVTEAGWVESTDKKLKGKSGCSPDGIVSETEWIEIKCLNSSNHIRYVTENKLPVDYRPQILNYFVINPDLKVVDFILYDPRIKTVSKRLHVIPVYREDHTDDIELLYNKLLDFHKLKDELYKKYLKKHRKTKSISQISMDGELIRTFSSCRKAADTLEVSISSIQRACLGKSKTSHKYFWKYNEN